MSSSAAQAAAAFPISLSPTIDGVTSYKVGPSSSLVLEACGFTLDMSKASDDVMPLLACFAPTGELIAQSFIWPGVTKQSQYLVVCSFSAAYPTPRPDTISHFPAQDIKDPFRMAGIQPVTLTPYCTVVLTLYEVADLGNNTPDPDHKDGVAIDVILWVSRGGDITTAVDVESLPPLVTYGPEATGREAPGLTR